MVSSALPGPAGDARLCWLWRQEGTWQVALGRRTGACRCFPKQREGGLGIHGVAMRQPRCTGSAAGFQTTESRASKVPGWTWAGPASCRATACHSHGDRPGVGGRRGSACSWLWSHRLCPQGCLPPVAPAEGVGQGDIRETPGSSQDREAEPALNPGIREQDCPCEPHPSPRGGSATSFLQWGARVGGGPSEDPLPPSPW